MNVPSKFVVAALISIPWFSSLFAEPFAWIARTPCPLARFEAAGGAADGKLYQFSGYYTGGSSIRATAECDAYDPVTNVWTRLADIPQPISHCGQVVDDQPADDQTFWLAGGFLGNHPGPTTNQVWKYSIKRNSWSAGPPLPEARSGGALVRLGRELHYFGGVVRSNGVYLQDYGTHWAFDLDTGSAWRTTTASGELLATLPNPRNHMGGVALNGKIYAIGGQHLGDEVNGAQSEVDVYNPSTNRWTQAAPMPRPIGHVTAGIFVRGGRIDVATGVTSNSFEIANVIEYDPSTNAWSELPPLSAARQSPVTGLVGNQIVVTSGSTDPGKEIPQTQTWVTTLTGALPTPWKDQDVGAVGAAGDASSSDYSSSFAVAGSGYGVTSTSDAYHYAFQPLHGDGRIVVRLATQQATNSLAQAGLMIRETLDPSSKHASILMTPRKGVYFQRRLSAGGATSQTLVTGSGITAPCWLKLVRAGNAFTAYYSTTGGAWTRLGSSTVSMASNVFIGLAVSSNANSVSTAAFTNLDLGPNANAGPDLAITLPYRARLPRSAIDDGLPKGTLTYNWKQVSGPGSVTFSATSPSTTLASFSAPGTYKLRLTANDTILTGTDTINVTVDPAR
ncbi:hypothetical protein BH18VER1_BH18VER1_02450 [soil metagenome]